MILTRHLSEDDLALFALQLLEGAELENALQHLERCEDCRHDVARYQGDLVGYALAMSELHSPPAQARERLIKRVAKEKKVVPVERPAPAAPVVPAVTETRPMAQLAERFAERAAAEQSSAAAPITKAEPQSDLRSSDGELFLASRGRRPFEGKAADEDEEPRRRKGTSTTAWLLGGAGWAIAACLAVAASLQYRQRLNVQSDLSSMNAKLQTTNATLANAQTKLDTLTDAGAMQVALHIPVNGQPEPPKPEGHAAYIADKGSLVFIADHLAPLQPYKTYELWLLPADGTDPVPAGLFKPDVRGVASVVMPDLPKGIAAKGFGVTIEDEGGSKTPTPPIVLAGM
jgi:anti-sigma-K factor RskA